MLELSATGALSFGSTGTFRIETPYTTTVREAVAEPPNGSLTTTVTTCVPTNCGTKLNVGFAAGAFGAYGWPLTATVQAYVNPEPSPLESETVVENEIGVRCKRVSVFPKTCKVGGNTS